MVNRGQGAASAEGHEPGRQFARVGHPQAVVGAGVLGRGHRAGLGAHPGHEAGLRSGDLVTRVGNHTVRSWEDLVLAIRQLEAGSTVEVRERRGSAEQTLQATVGSRPVDSR